MKFRVLSGAQPSAESMHLGNYIGAINTWAKMQEEYEAFFFVPNMHAITVPQEPTALKHQTRLTVAQYIAAGINPEKATLFIQSHVPEHTELAWVLNCMTGFGEAARMTQFKDKAQKIGNEKSSVGLFTYPILMAADILLYQAKYVPVGEDQRQHLELTRNIAQRFNSHCGEVFTIPEPYILKESAKIQDLQNPQAKMSKSAVSSTGLVNIMDSDKTTAKKIRAAITDNDSVVRYDPVEKPGISNLMTIYSVLNHQSMEGISAEFSHQGYGHFKGAVADRVVATLSPIRERALELMKNQTELDYILAAGAQKAREIASLTLAKVYDKVGFIEALNVK